MVRLVSYGPLWSHKVLQNGHHAIQVCVNSHHIYNDWQVLHDCHLSFYILSITRLMSKEFSLVKMSGNDIWEANFCPAKCSKFTYGRKGCNWMVTILGMVTVLTVLPKHLSCFYICENSIVKYQPPSLPRSDLKSFWWWGWPLRPILVLSFGPSWAKVFYNSY